MPALLQGAAAEYLRNKFGGDLTVEEISPTVGTSAIALFGNDPECVMFVVMNLSANNVFVAFDEQVSATHGFRIDALGGSLEVDVEADGMIPSLQLFGVASDVDSDLYIVKVRRFTRNVGQEVQP